MLQAVEKVEPVVVAVMSVVATMACGVAATIHETQHYPGGMYISGRNRVCMCPRVYALLTDRLSHNEHHGCTMCMCEYFALCVYACIEEEVERGKERRASKRETMSVSIWDW